MSDRKWILITGGTRGIGRGLVVQLAKSGYNIVFTYKASCDLANELEQEASINDTFVRGVSCDGSNKEAVDQLAKAITEELGPPYGIINNAGITNDSLMLNMDSGSWLDVINTNLNSAFYIIRAFLPYMIENGDGVILQMSSISGIKGNAGQTNYSSSKAGLIGLSKSLSVEVGRFGIRVNTILPGFIQTKMIDGLPEKEVKNIKKSIPMRRLGTVEDVSALADFLLSSGATYITGQNFIVDGGLSA